MRPMIRRLFARRAMLADEWASDVFITLGEDGIIASVTPNAPPGNAERAAGPVIPGARADLVVLDGGHVDLAGREEDTILDALVFSGNDNLVRDVIVSGKWVVREGRADGEDAIAARYRNALLRLID